MNGIRGIILAVLGGGSAALANPTNGCSTENAILTILVGAATALAGWLVKSPIREKEFQNDHT